MKKLLKIVGIIIVVLIVLSLLFGGSDDSSKKEITDTQEASVSEDTPSAPEKKETVKEETQAKASITIDEQVLFEKDGFKVTAKEYEQGGFWGDGIKLLLENDSTKDIGLSCSALIVNDYMITDLFSQTVAAGKKSNETLDLYSSALNAAGIENVGKVEIYFHTFDPESYMTIDEIDPIEIHTSAYDKMDTTPNDSGKELFNDRGVRIVGKYVDESSFWGAAVLLYIENNSGSTKIIQCDDMSINGFMVTPYFSSTVYDGKKAISDITLLSNELEENGITSVDEIELKFKLIEENFMDSYETDTITFSAK